MALFQIAEPGQSQAPHEHRLAVGIDLGTTNSLVASVISGSTEVICDEDGEALLPSVVQYKSDEAVVGRAAREAQNEDPANTIFSVKRLIGRSSAEVDKIQNLPYKLVDNGSMVCVETDHGVKTPIEVSAEILRKLAERAEARLGGELKGAVITVPAYFDDAQRQATKDAAKIAGLTVLRLLNEPTAAALAYGLDNAAEGLYIVYDLGGGTFDVSLLKLTKGIFEVLATGGDTALGGDDFDHAVFDWTLEQARCAGLDPSGMTMHEKSILIQACRSAKEALSSSDSAVIEATVAGGGVKLELAAEKFEEMTKALVERTIRSMDFVLADAKVSTDDLKGVVLVGGSTRMPVVRSAIQARYGLEPLTGIDPDKVVAVGAAMQANKLVGNSGEDDDWLLMDVTPLSLGLEMMGGLVEKVIPRNSAIPIARAQDFTTFKDGQTAMAIHVLQGERELVDKCRSLARFELRGIPAMAAGAARIRVTFEVDADGILSVSAREMTTGVESSVMVKPSYGLSDEEIVRMLTDGNKSAKLDMVEREWREQTVEAQRLIESTNSALNADGELLSAEERAVIDARIDALESALQTKEIEVLRAAIDSLTKATEEFAARRMDKAIAAALTGRSLDDEIFSSESK